MLIHLIRHTTPDITPGTCYGQSDLPLADGFEAEKNRVHEKLLDHYDAVFSSPLQRCLKLAETISGGHLTQDKRIMEYNFGDWELLPWREIKGDYRNDWAEDFVNIPAPNGESMALMKARVDDFFEDLFDSEYQQVAIVTHSGVQRLMHAQILETPLELMFRLQLDFGCVLELTRDTTSGLMSVKHL